MDLKNGAGFLGKSTDGVSMDRSMMKIVLMAIFGIGLSFLAGFFLRAFMVQGGTNNFVISSVVALGFLAVFLLCAFFIKGGWIVNLIAFLESAAFLGNFYDKFSNVFAVGVLLGFLFITLGIYAGRNELENSLEIKFWRIAKKVLPKAIAGMALFASVACSGFIDVKGEDFFITRKAFDIIVSPITDSGLFQKIIPGIDLSGSLEETIKSIATQEMENNPQLKNLPSDIKEQMQNRAIQEVKSKTSGITGSALDFQNKLSDTLYDLMVVKFYSLPEDIISSTPAIIAAFIFLVIIGFVWPIRLIVALIAFLLYEILLALGFGTIILEGKSKENVILN